MPAAIIASESAFSLSGRLSVSVATRSESSKRRSSVSLAIAGLLPGRHARRRGTIACSGPLGYDGADGDHPPRARGGRGRDARDLRALRARYGHLLRDRAALRGGVPAARPGDARGRALAPLRGGRRHARLRLRRALPPAARLPVDGRGDGVRAPGVPPQGCRPRPVHVAARLPRAAGFPRRGRHRRTPQPGERGPSRADGLRAGRGAARRRLQARALARRWLVAARARGARRVARAAAAAGGSARESGVAPQRRGRGRTRARLGVELRRSPVRRLALVELVPQRRDLALQRGDLPLLRLDRRDRHAGVAVEIDGHAVGTDGRALAEVVDDETEVLRGAAVLPAVVIGGEANAHQLRAQPAALRVVEVAHAVLEATARDRTARLRRIAIRAEERLAARAARIAPLAPLAARRAQLLRRAWRRAGGRRLDRAHGPAAGEVVAAGIAAGRQGGGGGGWGRRALGGRAGTAGEGPADGAHAQALLRTRAVRTG